MGRREVDHHYKEISSIERYPGGRYMADSVVNSPYVHHSQNTTTAFVPYCFVVEKIRHKNSSWFAENDGKIFFP